MKRHLTAAVALASLCLAGPALAANGNIGIYFDTDAALCQGTIPCGQVGQIFVYGLLQGSSGAGITGAEFGITPSSSSLWTNYLFSETPPAGTIKIGDAFGGAATGTNLAWPSCQVGDGTKVLLLTVNVLNLGCSATEYKMTVAKKASASNQFFQCPLFTLCDDPFFTKVCLGSNLVTCQNPEPPRPLNSTCSTSGQAYLNPGPTRNCTVAVANGTWSSMKGLYS